MADDEKELNKEENEQQKKDWQWDASAPLANENFLDITLPDNNGEDEESIAEDSQDAQEEDAEQDKSDVSSDTAGSDNSDTLPGYCIICGEKIKKSKSELYCNECRTKYMKVDYGASHIILSILMVIIAIAGIVTFVSTSKIADAVKEGDRLVDQGKETAALDAYYNVDIVTQQLNDSFNAFLKGISPNFDTVTFYDSGAKVGKKKAELLVKTYSMATDEPDTLFSVINSAFTQKELNSKKYKDVKDFYDFLKKFNKDTQNLFADLQSSYSDIANKVYSGEAENGEAKKETAKIFAEVDKYEKNHPDLAKGSADFFKYSFVNFLSQSGVDISDDEVLKYIDSACGKVGNYKYIFLQSYVAAALAADSYEGIISACDNALEINCSNVNAYYFKSMAYMRMGKFDEALEACDKVEEYSTTKYDNCEIKASILRRKKEFRASVDVCESVPQESKTSELLRQEAISYYLLGDKENAFKYAKESYDSAYADAANSSSAFSLEAVNTSALIYKLCDKEEEYDAIIDALKQSNSELEDSVKAVIKGDKTFEDIFMSGKGDI